MDVRGARCLARRLLCLADAAPQRAQSQRRGTGCEGPRQLPCQRPDLRCPACVARPDLGRDFLWAAPDRAPDAPAGPKSAPQTAAATANLGERQAGAIASNMLDRSFDAPAPNRKWIADFTYIWTAEGWLYVAAVVDLFSRRVVGWSMSASMTAQLVTDALVMAIWRRGKPRALLHHSDRGSQYTSEQFQRLMADHGVTCSMSRSGNCWDNAAMESSLLA